MFIASATNVVDMTLMPAMPGTITSRSVWLPANTAPNRNRNSSGRTKLKNAALGLRQNILRSRRYWRQVRARSLIGRGLVLAPGRSRRRTRARCPRHPCRPGR